MDDSSPLLTIPQDRKVRWQLVREITASWFPRAKERGLDMTPAGTSAPSSPPVHCPALLEWFEIVREFPKIWCRQDALFEAHFYGRNENFLIIGVENQACAFWGVRRCDLSQDDPPVYLDPSAKNDWIVQNSTTSEFALTWLASCIKWSDLRRCWASAVADSAALQIVERELPRLSLPDWHWPEVPTRFHGTANLLVEVSGRPSCTWLYVSARSRAAFLTFQQLLVPAGIVWDSSSDEWPDGWVSAAEDLD